jgi:hypothetical protein
VSAVAIIVRLVEAIQPSSMLDGAGSHKAHPRFPPWGGRIIVGFMTWMWASIIVVLVGAKLNAEIEHQTARETTLGSPKPLGKRGAKMADTIGPAQA